MDYKDKVIKLLMSKELTEEQKSKLLDIFPELKESEDERIRKEMIFYFTEEIPQCSIQEHSDKMREFISWLERQEVECTKLELKAGNSYFCYKSRWERADSETFKKGLIYKCNKDGVLDNFVIKNPEQHFIEIKDERIAYLEKQDEQKPWSEENERMVTRIVESLSTYADKLQYEGFCHNSEVLYEQIKWLKSLKGRVQPKQEWSEEDEKMRAAVLQLITDSEKENGWNCVYCNDKEIYFSDIIAWLKSLKPQNRWNPSDEQMRGIDCAIKTLRYQLNVGDKRLNSLYDDLKKLREK